MLGLRDITLSTFALNLHTGLKYQNHPDSKGELTTDTKAISSRDNRLSVLHGLQKPVFSQGSDNPEGNLAGSS